ncbi:hypothetical protein Anapl_09232 [Anas platyrhynchos]|uniref:Uncharacterized protein n=1 Tax=Anas platyrhynchos TaxID=8839 RepID=R0LRV3_ANAPL|nr:hypothetical protein Anapl_09232 [Anas platyrhynchos]
MRLPPAEGIANNGTQHPEGLLAAPSQGKGLLGQHEFSGGCPAVSRPPSSIWAFPPPSRQPWQRGDVVRQPSDQSSQPENTDVKVPRVWASIGKLSSRGGIGMFTALQLLTVQLRNCRRSQSIAARTWRAQSARPPAAAAGVGHCWPHAMWMLRTRIGGRGWEPC